MSIQDRPITQPRWADDPPVAPPTTITEPTSQQKDEGWQPAGSATFPDGKPVREIMNWLLNLIYQWLLWLDIVTHRTGDQSPDHVLPGSNPPGTGAGLGPVAAGDFSARVYVGGYERGPEDSPEHTYAASSDTYWDLGRDGAWTPVVVAAMDPAPAITANSVRVFAVRTDATDRTAVILDNTEAALNIDQPVERVWGDETDAARELARTIYKVKSGAGEWSLIDEIQEDVTGIIVRRYFSGDWDQEVITWNARWGSAAAEWTPDNPGISYFESVGPPSKRALFVDSSGGAFPAIWVTSNPGSLAEVTHVHRLAQASQVVAMTAASEEVVEALPLISWSKPSSAERHSEYTTIGPHLSLFGLHRSAQGTDGDEGIGGFLISNATWDYGTQEWNLVDSGEDAYKLTLDKSGLRLLVHKAADGDAWVDEVGATKWLAVDAMSGGATATKRLVIPGSAIKTSGSTVVQPGLPNVQIGSAAQGFDNPVEDASDIGIARAIAGASSGKTGVWPITGLPNGAIVTGVKVQGGWDTPAAEEIRVAMVKLNGSTNARTSFRSGTAYDVITGGDIATYTEETLTIDAAESVRTIDNELYSYYLWVGEKAGDENHLWVISRWVIEYVEA